jgi:hypothetical protein
MSEPAPLYQNPKTCPHCGTNLVASQIPAANRKYYLPQGTPDDGRELLYYRTIGISSVIFDRILAYTCPDCKAIDVIPGCESMFEADRAHWQASKPSPNDPPIPH